MISIDQREGTIWMDGKYVNWPDAKIHILTHGLHYGSSVYEGIRIYNFKLFKAKEHFDRLLNSASMIGIKIDYTSEELVKICEELMIKTNQIQGYVRPLIWRGSQTLRLGAHDNINHIAISMWDVGTKSNLSEDVQMYSLALSKWRKAPKNVLPASIKGAGAYTMNIVAKHEAEARGYDDAILLDIDGNVAEVTTSNIFIVKDNVLITPPPVNVLNGITRLTVLDISKEMNIKIEEKFFDLEYMQAADEVFLTGTSIEIMPVCRVENTIFQLGDITKLIIKKYHEVIYS